MIRIYLDLSSLNRIFDDQSSPRIYMESSAMLVIFRLIEENKVKVINSAIVKFENSQNPYQERKIFVNRVLNKAETFQDITPSILERAQLIEETGVSGLDTLHLASAEVSKSDYFITCDDDIIKKYEGKIKVINPIEFVNTFLEE